MAISVSRSLLRTAYRPRAGHLCLQCRRYATPSATDLPAAPLLLKLRTDLKTAMKEKDKVRLNVLRGLLADITNSAKTNTPIKTDIQVLSLLRKRAKAAKEAEEEFRQAGREDLVEREGQQAKVLDEIASTVDVMSMEDIRKIVTSVVEDISSKEGRPAKMPEVLKRLLGPEGDLAGKPVEKAEVAKIVKEVVPQS